MFASCKSKINTLLVIQTPPPFGGGEIQAQYLKKHFLNRNGYFIYDYSRKWHSRRRQENISLFSFLFGIYWILKVFYLVLKYSPDKLYFTLPKSFLGFIRNSIVILICSFCKVKVFAELPGLKFPFIDGSNSIKDRIGKYILKSVYQLRLLSNSIKNNFEKMGINNGIVIENGVEIPEMFISRNVPQNTAIKLLFIGSISEEKGFGDCLNALKVLNNDSINYHFDVIGEFIDKKEKKLFLDFIKKNNLVDKITFYGVLFGDAKWEVMKNNNILLLPSYFEGVPLVILEAMGMGLTIISTKLDGVKDTIEDGINGFLVNPGDYLKLSLLIKEIFYNRDILIEIRERNFKKYYQKYTLKIFLNNMEKWFNG